MQITLLPPLLPTEGPTPVQKAPLALIPGMKVLATVLTTTADGGTLLSLGGRHVPSGASLPYPPGATLHLEVIEGGDRPLLRLVGTEGTAGRQARTPPPPVAAPVSPLTYGLAAAVMAARAGTDSRQAAMTLAGWVPTLVAAGVLSSTQGEALMRTLMPVSVPDPSGGEAATAAVARALADRVSQGGLLMERRLADVVRGRGPDAEGATAGDVRARLAALGSLLHGVPPPLDGARAAVVALQDALLAEQARAAAHLARDGVVDVRVPLQVAGQDGEIGLRLRLARDAPEHGHPADPAPWRTVRLDLALEGLGRVQVLLGIVATQVRAEFIVEQGTTADLIEAGLAELATSLEAVGFAQVLSRVVVDPVRAGAPDALPELPSQRAIVDAQA